MFFCLFFNQTPPTLVKLQNFQKKIKRTIYSELIQYKNNCNTCKKEAAHIYLIFQEDVCSFV